MPRALSFLFSLFLLLALAVGVPGLGCPSSDDDDSGHDDDDSGHDDDDATGDDDDATGDDDDATGDDDDATGDDDDATGDDDDSSDDDDDDSVGDPSISGAQLMNPLAHAYGGSPCPTPGGFLMLSNPGSSALSYNVQATPNQSSIPILGFSSSPATRGSAPPTTMSGTVPAGGSMNLYVSFNCNDASPSQTVTLSADLGGVEGATFSVPFVVNVSGGPG